ASGSQQSESNAEWVEGAVPSPLAGHAVNPSLGAQLGLSPSRLLLQPPMLQRPLGLGLPADTRGRLVALEWLLWQVGGLGPMSGQMAHFSVYAQETIPYAVDRCKTEVRRLHRVLDQRLAEHSFVAGAEYGIADMASYPWFEVCGDLKPDYAAFPHLRRWQGAIAARPAVQRAYALKEQVNPNAGRPLSDEERQHMFGRR
ncbi:glutathione S-transferase, partial [Xanthomonas arboricola pv. pruni str. MAFF 311562]